MNERPTESVSLPRYAPGYALPAYSYVPLRFPHPLSDEAGHRFGNVQVPHEQRFAYAVDLFNHGYYWEAHETWEALWQACGRSGSEADFFKGLIKLAAAGVKAREGNAAGVARHARRAGELLQQVRDVHGDAWHGCDLAELQAWASAIEHSPEIYLNGSNAPVVRIFDKILSLRG